jgi:hypothetical protein
MKRLATLAACLGVFPAAVRANDAPAPAPTLPGTVVPAPPGCYQPLPVAPTVPPISVDDCGRVSGCPSHERCGAGLGGMLNPLHRLRERGTECGSCGRVSEGNYCPSCGSRLRLGDLLHRNECGRDRRACWERVKEWVCWKPGYATKLPLRPIPYQTPLIAYFPCCKEPTIPVGPGCGHGCGAGCGPAGCAAKAEGAPAAHGRATRLAGVLDVFRMKKSQAVAADADMTAIAPGLRFANPTSPPAPPAAYAQPPSGPGPVAPANYTRPAAAPQQPLAARPFSNP